MIFFNYFSYILHLDPAKVIATDSNISLIEDSNEPIVCRAIGTPNLRINWKTDDNIFLSDKLDYNVIKQMNKSDAVQLNFTCVAENHFGIDSRTTSIKLIGKIKRRIQK